MSAYSVARVYSWVLGPIWFVSAVVLANSLPVPWAIGASVALMLGLGFVSYDILVCPRCRRSIFTSKRRWLASGPQKTCSRCSLDLKAHRLGDRRFKEDA